MNVSMGANTQININMICTYSGGSRTRVLLPLTIGYHPPAYSTISKQASLSLDDELLMSAPNHLTVHAPVPSYTRPYKSQSE